MPRFSVDIPFAGYLSGEVEAPDAKAAIDKALSEWDFRVVVESDAPDFECAEVTTLHDVSTGNVNHAPLCHAAAEPIDEGAEE